MIEGVLFEIASEFDAAKRQGSDVDDPEGSRFITMSDTLARNIAMRLRGFGSIPLADFMERAALQCRLDIAELRRTLNDPGSYDLPPGSLPSWRRGIWA